jgi:hypothetical protein
MYLSTLASYAGLSMGFSLRMGIEKKYLTKLFGQPDSPVEMPVEEAI